MQNTKKPKHTRHADIVRAALPDFGRSGEPAEPVGSDQAFTTTSRPMAEVRQITLTEIRPDDTQPRSVRIDSEGIADLTRSIRAQGVLNPIILRRDEQGYVIIAGERRWTAARAVGLERIPARVMDVSNEEARLIQLAENLQREDLNSIEEAEGLNLLMRETGWSTSQLGERLGKSKSYVSRMVSITTRFSAAIQAKLRTVADPQRPPKSMIFEALSATSEDVQRQILFGGLTQTEARRLKGKRAGRSVPKNTLEFRVPGHGTWIFKQERGRRTLKELDASQSYPKLRILIDRALAPMPRRHEGESEQSDS